MKAIQKNLFPVILTVLLITLSAGRTLAHYDHDDKGWYDEHHVHHPFIMHDGHRGYWDHDPNGVSVFINIG
ncbi:MAG: hypothetical protein LV481_00135 [Methylacidiphilales bacterium]|nr:hypothetical protein [Candidatus Methylacidiphilales bacterium]